MDSRSERETRTFLFYVAKMRKRLLQPTTTRRAASSSPLDRSSCALPKSKFEEKTHTPFPSRARHNRGSLSLSTWKGRFLFKLLMTEVGTGAACERSYSSRAPSRLRTPDERERERERERSVGASDAGLCVSRECLFAYIFSFFFPKREKGEGKARECAPARPKAWSAALATIASDVASRRLRRNNGHTSPPLYDDREREREIALRASSLERRGAVATRRARLRTRVFDLSPKASLRGRLASRRSLMVTNRRAPEKRARRDPRLAHDDAQLESRRGRERHDPGLARVPAPSRSLSLSLSLEKA